MVFRGRKGIGLPQTKIIQTLLVIFVIVVVIFGFATPLYNMVERAVGLGDELCDSGNAILGYCEVNEEDADDTFGQEDALSLFNSKKIEQRIEPFDDQSVESLSLSVKRSQREIFLLNYKKGVWSVEGAEIPENTEDFYTSLNSLDLEDSRFQDGVSYFLNNLLPSDSSYNLDLSLFKKEGELPTVYLIDYRVQHKEDGEIRIQYRVNPRSNNNDKIAQKVFVYEEYKLHFLDLKGQGRGIEVTEGQLEEELYNCFRIVLEHEGKSLALRNYDLYCKDTSLQRSLIDEQKQETLPQKVQETISRLESESVGEQNALEYLFAYSSSQGVDPYLSLSILSQESVGEKNALSFVGAAGLMQLMPETARGQGLKVPNYDLISLKCVNSNGVVYYDSEKRKREITACNTCQVQAEGGDMVYRIGASQSQCDLENDERFDVQKAIEGGVDFIVNLQNAAKTEGRITYIIAAYNGGFKALNPSESCPGETFYECEKNKGYAETRDYVKQVSSFYSALQKTQEFDTSNLQS